MNWLTEFIESRNYVKVTLTGDFNTDDQLRLIEDIMSQEYWKPGMNTLLDSRKVNYSNAGIDIMRQASGNVTRFAKQIGAGKAAILVETALSFGKGRQFQMLTEENSSSVIRIFLDESQALEWLEGDNPSNERNEVKSSAYIHP